jgi:glycosyltransferase involved in cell wall biosynthesis
MPVASFGRSAPIRIARIITRLNIGGPSIQAAELSSRLSTRGFDTMLVHGTADPREGDMSYLLARGERPVRSMHVAPLLRSVAPASDISAVRTVYRLLEAFKPAIVHTHTAKAGTVGRLAALLYNRRAGREAPARLVHTYHGHVLEGYFSPARTALFVRIERCLARATDRLVAISPRIRDELVGQHRIGRSEQYRVVPLGFDLQALAAIDDAARACARRALQIPPAATVVTTVGRLTAIKNQRLFLEVAARVDRRHPSVIFLIAGDGELRGELEAAAQSLGIAGRVRFLGWRRDLETVYGASDVFVLTSRNEGTPVALIESSAAGVPVISTDVGGVRDVVENDELGLLAAADPDALAGAVDALLADPARCHAIGGRGRAAVLARYGIDRLLDDVEKLYRELLPDGITVPAPIAR